MLSLRLLPGKKQPEGCGIVMECSPDSCRGLTNVLGQPEENKGVDTPSALQRNVFFFQLKLFNFCVLPLRVYNLGTCKQCSEVAS